MMIQVSMISAQIDAPLGLFAHFPWHLWRHSREGKAHSILQSIVSNVATFANINFMKPKENCLA